MSSCYSLGTSVVLLAVGVFLDRLGMWFWPKIVDALLKDGHDGSYIKYLIEKWTKRGK